MKVAVLSIYSFPYGLAATNRISAYTQGLVANGVDVDVISLHPTEPYPHNSEKLPDEGFYKGVHYINPSGRYRNKFKLLRALAIKTGYRFWRGYFKIKRLLKANKYDAVILSFDEPEELDLYARIAKSSGSKVVFIFDEYPIPIRHELKDDIPEEKKEKYRKTLPQIDGYISISQELADYYNKFASHPSLLVPVIVNTSKFHQPDNCIVKENWITYIGNLELAKDNVNIIVEAFGKISDNYPEMSLHFYGPKREKTLNLINEIAKKYNISDRVVYEGLCNNDDVPAVISKSKVMVSSQPDTKRAKGGFPTKLGEYVVMGTPTLICDVGENKMYVTEDDCYYSKPDNIDDYADKLDYILSHYEEALNKAMHGIETIKRKYSNVAAGSKMAEFIKSL